MKTILCLLGISSCLLTVLAQDAQSPNLLEKRTTTKFWYPPYAKSQPAVKDGAIVLDLKQAAGKDMAV